MYRERTPLGVAGAKCVKDIADLVPPVHNLQMRIPEAGSEEEEEEKNKNSENKLRSLMSCGVDLLRVVASTEIRCVVRLFLPHCLVDFKNPGPLTRHCMAYIAVKSMYIFWAYLVLSVVKS